MRRYLLVGAVAAAVALVAAPAAPALVAVAPNRPVPQRAVTAEVVVVGKVTAIEKDTVDAAPFPGAPMKVAYKIAVVKVETNLAGANGTTHIKIGFIPPAPAPVPPIPGQPGKPMVRPIRPGLQLPELKEGQEMLFFVSKHPSANFYVMSPMSAPVPVDAKTDAGKKEIEAVKKITDLLADPMKGLKSDKADVRTETAVLMVTKYRSYPESGGEVDEVAIGADESKLILKAIADADWKQAGPRPGGPVAANPNAMQAFYQLGLNDKDGWKQPVFPQPQPGQPPVDFVAIQKDAFVKWLAGAGKDYQIKKIVAKKTEK